MKNNIETWKKLLDFLDRCDADDIPIYAKLPTVIVPVDNFEFMKIGTSKDPDELTYLRIVEDDDGVLYLTGS